MIQWTLSALEMHSNCLIWWEENVISLTKLLLSDFQQCEIVCVVRDFCARDFYNQRRQRRRGSRIAKSRSK